MFKVRTSPPSQWDKLYNNGDNGGISWCITGQPTNSISNVLANCVGWACSRFNEIYNEETGYDGMKYRQLCCNAEDFWTVADTLGLKKGQEPKAGAIMCWEGVGSLAGHVAIVERVDSSTQVFTSESGWQSAFFWNSTRAKGDSNWGANSNYRFRGFIYNPAVKELAWKHEWHLYDGDKELTGWQKVNGYWYYLNSQGVMQTGWIKTNGRWYYLNGGNSGRMLTGWQYIGGKWYYLQPKNDGSYKEGEMRIGWLFDSDPKYNCWFLLSGNGDMLTGWQKVKNKWYYLQPNKSEKFKFGEMVTGWLKWEGSWYYLDPKDGYMYTGTHTIDGKTYTFDSSGRLVS